MRERLTERLAALDRALARLAGTTGETIEEAIDRLTIERARTLVLLALSL